MVWVCDLSAFVCGLLCAHFSHTHTHSYAAVAPVFWNGDWGWPGLGWGWEGFVADATGPVTN